MAWPESPSVTDASPGFKVGHTGSEGRWVRRALPPLASLRNWPCFVAICSRDPGAALTIRRDLPCAQHGVPDSIVWGGEVRQEDPNTWRNKCREHLDADVVAKVQLIY